MEYLGFLAGKDGLKVNPPKLKSIMDFPVPTKVRDVQAFLGLVGYFRIFVKKFAEKAKPLYKLLKQAIPWKWEAEQQDAFDILKSDLIQAPVLAFPDFSKPFILTTDASGYAIGAMLSQIQNGFERLIACNSRVLTDCETRYNNTD